MFESLAATLTAFKQCLLKQNEVIVPYPYLQPHFGFKGTQGQTPSKRLLLVYLPQALYEQQPELILHANVSTVRMIAEALAARGYIIDAIDWSDPQPQIGEDYDLVFCLSVANASIIERVAQIAPTIYFVTEQYLPYQRAAFNARVWRLFWRRRVHLTKQYPHERSAAFPNAKALILKGNARVVETVQDLGIPIYVSDNFALPLQIPDLSRKAFGDARRNFLWLGSSSLLHKGLDLVLEAFAKMPEFHLWICGPVEVEAERAFVQAYHRELFQTPNIHAQGWTNVVGDGFAELASRCAFLIYPSCSEAQAGSVLNCMTQGIVPIITVDTGIDVEDFGVMLPDTKISTIRRIAREMAEMPTEHIYAMAAKAQQVATERYTAENFRARITEILEELLPDA